MNTTVLLIGGCALITAAIKAVGPVALGGRELPERLIGVIALMAPALLAALVVTATLADADEWAIGADTAGVTAGGLVAWRTGVGRRVRGGGGGGDRAGARRFVTSGPCRHPRRALRSPTMSATAVDRPSAAPRLLFAAALGALVAVALGVYGRVHDPSQELVFTLFFSSTIAMKVWLGSIAAVLAVVQVISAMWVYGRLPGRAPEWAGGVHRISGRLAFIVSLPVAYHCLWSLGFQDTDTRVLAHSLLGCAVYGAFASKVTIVRSTGTAGAGASGGGRDHVRRADRGVADQRSLVHRRERLARPLERCCTVWTSRSSWPVGSWLRWW